jgi:hypothetical protein
MELLHCVPFLFPIYPSLLLLHLSVILALTHPKEQIQKTAERRGGFLLLTILSRPPPVRPVSGTSQTGLGLGSRSRLELLSIDSRLCNFFRCDLRLSLRRRNNGVLHQDGPQRLMSDFRRKLNPRHSLNHKHNARVIAADLLRIL